MKTWKYSFKSVPIMSVQSKRVSRKTVEHTITYDLSHVGHHTMELNLWKFVFRFEWLLGIFMAAAGMLMTGGIASLFSAGTVGYWLCIGIGFLISLAMGFYIGVEGIVQNEMKKTVVRERGGKKSSWRCVKEQHWEGFRKQLSSRL
jgi:hypothetical protein